MPQHVKDKIGEQGREFYETLLDIAEKNDSDVLPPIRVLADTLGYKSTSTIWYHTRPLVAAGLIGKSGSRLKIMGGKWLSPRQTGTPICVECKTAIEADERLVETHYAADLSHWKETYRCPRCQNYLGESLFAFVDAD